MNDHCSLRVAVVGEGEGADKWDATLAGAGVCERPKELSEATDAVVVAPGCGDPFARTKAALLAGIPVLYAAPFLLRPWQANVLNELSGRQERLLRFVEPFQYQRGFAFLHRLLAGEEPFWRPLYLRALRLAPVDGPARIDELATEELAICEALLDSTPRWVTAAASRRDEVAEVSAVFLTLHYGNGLAVQCTISLAEANSAHQLVAVTPDRTIILDDQDPIAPLRIVGKSMQELFTEEASAGPLAQAGPDPLAEEAKRFLRAVAEGDRSSANGDRWTRVAALWWAACHSMSFGGLTEVPSPTSPPGHAEPPLLRVIRGGGRTVPATWQRPPLTLVAR